MTTLPKLPDPDAVFMTATGSTAPFYSTETLDQYGRQCIEAAAKITESKEPPNGMSIGEQSIFDVACLMCGSAIRAMLTKGKI
jgi:hypothetical protein